MQYSITIRLSFLRIASTLSEFCFQSINQNRVENTDLELEISSWEALRFLIKNNNDFLKVRPYQGFINA